ncbi:MAG TPA: DUF2971 domain-containing protein [Cellvibrio sp.]|nr:DUF2971 domain-containing protein [Cellvibrio sp.]
MSNEYIKKSTHALDEKINELYHYQSFNKEHLELLLKDRTIYCSTPSSFNDPWDCKPWYNTALLDDETEYLRHLDFIRENANFEDGILDMLAKSRTQLEALLDRLSAGMAKNNDRCFRIYCLTPDSKNPLMWSHYADKHRGICLEYHTNNTVIGSAWKVEYNEAFPTIKFYEKTNDPMFHLLHKSDVWSYEQEYRIIAHEPQGQPDYDESSLCCKDGVLHLPNNALKSIIVGCNAKYEEVFDFIKSMDPAINVRRATRSSNQYSLKIE